MLKVDFQPEAQAEFNAIGDYYDSQREGLGDRFGNAVFDQLVTIAGFPYASQSYFNGYRSARPRHFPYLIIFTVEPDCIIIQAIVHAHRDPGEIRKRLNPQSEGKP